MNFEPGAWPMIRIVASRPICTIGRGPRGKHGAQTAQSLTSLRS
jgi:hypothetical protein